MSSEEQRRVVTSEETTFLSGEEGDEVTVVKQGESIIAVRDHPTDGFASPSGTGIVIIRDDGDDGDDDGGVVIDTGDGDDDGEDSTPPVFDPCDPFPALLTATRGLVDHWIAECTYIGTQSGDACTGPLDFWNSSQGGRTRFDEINSLDESVTTIVLLENQINSLSAIFLPDDNPIRGNDHLRVLGSENNSAYDYLHGINGWVALVWKEIDTVSIDGTGLIRQDTGGNTGIHLRVQASDLALNPDTIRFIIRADGGSGASNWFDVVFSDATVKMGDWNYIITSWDSGGSRDGIRIMLNGGIQDFDATEFKFAHSTLTAVRTLNLGRRRAGGDTESPILIPEVAMGNVSLNDAEIVVIEDYIKCKYAL